MKYTRFLLFSVDSFYQTIRLQLPWLWALLDLLTLALIDILRLGASRRRAYGLEQSSRPRQPLKLYEFEGCPFCRRVRETLCLLDIDHIVYPCPRETFGAYGVCLNSRFRPEVKKEGGIALFPFLVDPNQNQKMYQSEDIMAYLWKTYGNGATAPWNFKLAFWKPYLDFSMFVCTLVRPSLDMGFMRAPARSAEHPLELWGLESSMYSRRVKEVLCVLELPYLFHVLPMGSEKRLAFAKDHQKAGDCCLAKFGFLRLPYLYDPNTKKELYDSQEIVRYLKEQYQTASVPSETWLDWGAKQ